MRLHAADGVADLDIFDTVGNGLEVGNAGVEAQFDAVADYREGNYYSNNGTKDNAILSGKVTQNWLTKSSVADFYQFGANDKTVNDYLADKFSFYHIAHDGKLYEMAAPYQNTDEVFGDVFRPGGVNWSLYEGKWLRAQPNHFV